MSEKKDPLHNVLLAFQAPPYTKPVMKEIKGQEVISWGADNSYPSYLLDLFYGSSLNNAIIIRKMSEIVGYGFYSQLDKNGINKFIKNCNDKGDSLNEILNKCVLDYLIFGGFALEIVYTKGTKTIAEIYYKDVSNLRFTPDQDKIKEAKNNWSLQKVKTLTWDIYNPLDPSGRKIFYYRGNMTRDVYPKPQYGGALSAISADILISDFWLSQIENGMFPSLHVNLSNGEPTEEEKDALERSLYKKFGGNSNAGKIFLTFSDKDNASPTINPVPQPDLDKRFIVLNDSIQSKIFFGHLFPPLLVGCPTPGKLGQSSEWTQASQLFTNKIVEPCQKIICDVFNKLLSVNFREPDLAIMPLKPIGNVITDQVLIASQMTPYELRKLFKEYGYIDSIDIPEGQTVIGDIASQVKPSDKKLLKPEVNPDETNHIPLPDNTLA